MSETQEIQSVLASLFPEAAIFGVDDQYGLSQFGPTSGPLMGCPEAQLVARVTALSRQMPGASVGEFTEVADAHGQMIAVRIHCAPFAAKGQPFAGGLVLVLPQPEPVGKREATTTEEQQTTGFHGIFTRTPQMQSIFNIIRNVSQTDVTVLIRGESGSGKELVARAIHNESTRKGMPFVAVNCAALSDNLLESELFGHQKGAFTGAVKDHLGLIQQAQGGTLFLDEIAELPMPLQAKLLRVLQERVFVPLGGEKEIPADIRIVSATHQSLRALVKKGQFREDLMYRLRVVPIFLPALRERRADITLLVDHFLKEFATRNQRQPREFAPEAMRCLLHYEWPGNIRELRNVVEYANAVSNGTVISVDDLPSEIIETDTHSEPSVYNRDDQERRKLRAILLECEGDLDSAAKQLGISRTTLWRKRKKYQL